MIKYLDGTVFNTDAEAIVNTVNTVGVMGAGLALEFSLRFPEMYKFYTERCKNGLLRVGAVDYYTYTDHNFTIVNFPTKWHFKYPSKIEWIKSGLENFVKTYKEHGIRSVAFPKLGTLNGGLDWLQVKKLMEYYLSPLDITVYICLDTLPYAEGKEAEMVERFNSTGVAGLPQSIRLTATQKSTLERAFPITRFWKLQDLPGIGITTYSKIFNHFFYHSFESSGEQLNLFD